VHLCEQLLPGQAAAGKTEAEMKKGFDHSKPSNKIAGAQEGTRVARKSTGTTDITY